MRFFFFRSNCLQHVYLHSIFEEMKVYKFGGASVQDAAAIENIGKLLAKYKGEPLLIVISAMGKTTNALENVAELFFKKEKDAALHAFDAIKKTHFHIVEELVDKSYAHECTTQLKDLFTEVEWLLHDEPVRNYAYYYDQIVCLGELLSTTIVHFYLQRLELKNQWWDVRDILRTNNNFRSALVDWEYTESKVAKEWAPFFDARQWILTQGFIGSTDENESTTLGREGSDFSAAVFANLLHAESLTIWKDVEGVMNADPKLYSDAQYLSHLSYEEVIEMAYYGAQIIHPKTIKPLQNKHIPLLVKCFKNSDLPGTTIDNQPATDLPPIIILKKDQRLFEWQTKDFSFVGEKPMSELYTYFAQLMIRPNLVQIGAIKLQLCMDNQPEKNAELLELLSEKFHINKQLSDLKLLTIRHFTAPIIDRLTEKVEPVLIQQTENTIQILYR